MIERITFDTSGWHEHVENREPERIVWGNAGDVLSLDVVPSPWKTFRPMEREKWLDDARTMAKPGGIVSVDGERDEQRSDEGEGVGVQRSEYANTGVHR